MPRGKLLVAAAVAAILFLPPMADGILLTALRVVGYTLCHQIPGHSLFAGEEQLPLCARCTGLYLGFMVGLLGMTILGKSRACRAPSGAVLTLLLMSLAIMAADGFNSLISLLPDGRTLYPPSNLLRLATGGAAGLSLSLILLPMLNDALWESPDPSGSVEDLGELGGYAILVAMALMVANSDQPLLLYPIAVISVAGAVIAISMAAGTLAAAILGRTRRATSAADARPVLLTGLAIAATAMSALGAARASLSPLLGL